MLPTMHFHEELELNTITEVHLPEFEFHRLCLTISDVSLCRRCPGFILYVVRLLTIVYNSKIICDVQDTSFGGLWFNLFI